MFETVRPRLDGPTQEIILGFELAGMDRHESLVGMRFLDRGDDFLPGEGTENFDQVGAGLELGPDSLPESVRSVHFHHDAFRIAFRAVPAGAGDPLPGDDRPRSDEDAGVKSLPGHDPDILEGGDVTNRRDAVHEAVAQKIRGLEGGHRRRNRRSIRGFRRPGEMNMGVDQAGDDRLPLDVHDLGVEGDGDLSFGPDGRESIAGDDDDRVIERFSARPVDQARARQDEDPGYFFLGSKCSRENHQSGKG
jgi:hypothetical protein